MEITITVPKDTPGEQNSLKNHPVCHIIKNLFREAESVFILHSNFMYIRVNNQPYRISIVKKEYAKFDDFLTNFDTLGIINRDYTFHLLIPDTLGEFLK